MQENFQVVYTRRFFWNRVVHCKRPSQNPRLPPCSKKERRTNDQGFPIIVYGYEMGSGVSRGDTSHIDKSRARHPVAICQSNFNLLQKFMPIMKYKKYCFSRECFLFLQKTKTQGTILLLTTLVLGFLAFPTLAKAADDSELAKEAQNLSPQEPERVLAAPA